MCFFWFRKRRSGGVIPQEEDPRDLQYTPVVSGGVGVDLRPDMKPVQDQNGYNACTAFAIGGLVDYLARKNLPSWDLDFSEAYQWYWARALEGSAELNEGCILRNQFKVLRDFGIVDSKSWNFSKGYVTSPDLLAQTSGAIQRDFMREFTGSYRVVSVDDIESALVEGLPVVFAMPIDLKFQYLKPNTAHVSTMGPNSFYHAMLVVGFNETEYIVRNSWGKAWGEAGYCYISKDLLKLTAFDLWTITPLKE